MKRLTLAVLASLAMFLIAACEEDEPIIEDEARPVLAAEEGDGYTVHHLRTDVRGGRHEEREHLVGIDSTEDLENYLEDKSDTFRFDQGYDEDDSFKEIIEEYDETFFEDHRLVFAVIEENSGSNHHDLEHIDLDADGNLSIALERYIPSVGTMDMAAWHIVFELDRDTFDYEEKTLEVDDVPID